MRIRKLKGPSLRDLASKTGLSQRMIRYYEHNPRSLPIDRITLLASALAVRFADFSEEELNASVDSLDIRWIKKIKDLKTLLEPDRIEISQDINPLLEKSRLQKDQAAS